MVTIVLFCKNSGFRESLNRFSLSSVYRSGKLGNYLSANYYTELYAA